MNRMRNSLFSLALLGAGLTPAWAQSDDWKPVSQHGARYQPGEEPGIRLGKPVRKVDRALQPAQFADVPVGASLPSAPPSTPLEYEVLPFPKTVLTATGKSAQTGGAPQQPPKPTLPGATPGPAEAIPGMPSGVPMGQGQFVGGPVYQGPIVTGPMGAGPEWVGEGVAGIGMPGIIGDRYYLSAPHGAPSRWYGSIDYVLWMISNDKTPALVTTGPQESNGILGEPGVSVLYGGEIGDATLNGGRLSLGFWFNRCQTWGLMGSVFATQRRNDHFFASSPGDPLLARALTRSPRRITPRATAPAR